MPEPSLSKRSHYIMNIHEYQAKEILGTYDIPVPRGRVCLVR